jgi:hypothetical protein
VADSIFSTTVFFLKLKVRPRILELVAISKSKEECSVEAIIVLWD